MSQGQTRAFQGRCIKRVLICRCNEKPVRGWQTGITVRNFGRFAAKRLGGAM